MRFLLYFFAISTGFSIGFLWDFHIFPCCVYDISMGLLWDLYGISMGVLWQFDGIPMASLWDFHRCSIVFL